MAMLAHRQAIAKYARLSPAERIAACAAALERLPRCPISHYLLGCHLFDTDQPARADRHMMISHHAAPALESAALLVFAGLNLITSPADPLLDVLLRTWDQFRRPQFDRLPLERALLDAFADPDGLAPAAGALTRGLWRLPLRTVRRQLREASADRPSRVYPRLLLASA